MFASWPPLTVIRTMADAPPVYECTSAIMQSFIINRAVDGKFGWVARLRKLGTAYLFPASFAGNMRAVPSVPAMRVTRQLTSTLCATDAKC